ncbi:MAG: toll/interleukin-1 receptor domain-containing protein [Planctomycetales bacterium]|nr:toll/interleukin-1 receptor domain-containing protein [Planctomycetales bacterium]
MNVFLSWSGEQSHGFALALREFLRMVFPTINPFVSSEDIRKGNAWSTVISSELRKADKGIVCITQSNCERPWLQFEAGALQVRHDMPVVYTVLVDDVGDQLRENPLSMFQHTRVERGDFLRLVRDLNSDLQSGQRSDAELEQVFDLHWDKLREQRDSLLSLPVNRKFIFLPDLVRNDSMIAGKVFENTLFRGPCVLAILPDCSFIECTFTMDDPARKLEMLWDHDGGMYGAIGVAYCQFRRCEFEGIGIAGSKDTLEKFVRNGLFG